MKLGSVGVQSRIPKLGGTAAVRFRSAVTRFETASLPQSSGFLGLWNPAWKPVFRRIAEAVAAQKSTFDAVDPLKVHFHNLARVETQDWFLPFVALFLISRGTILPERPRPQRVHDTTPRATLSLSLHEDIDGKNFRLVHEEAFQMAHGETPEDFVNRVATAATAYMNQPSVKSTLADYQQAKKEEEDRQDTIRQLTDQVDALRKAQKPTVPVPLDKRTQGWLGVHHLRENTARMRETSRDTIERLKRELADLTALQAPISRETPEGEAKFLLQQLHHTPVAADGTLRIDGHPFQLLQIPAPDIDRALGGSPYSYGLVRDDKQVSLACMNERTTYGPGNLKVYYRNVDRGMLGNVVDAEQVALGQRSELGAAETVWNLMHQAFLHKSS